MTGAPFEPVQMSLLDRLDIEAVYLRDDRLVALLREAHLALASEIRAGEALTARMLSLETDNARLRALVDKYGLDF